MRAPWQHATLVSPPQSAAVAANVAALASALKGETQRAWAAEAVRRGVAHAKSGDTEAALCCYAQALELDPAHRDAHVARGAALANCGRLREGQEACEAALLLDPSDRNARQYLDAIAAKLAAQAAEPEPEPVPAALREQAAEAPGQRRAEEAPPPPPAAAAGLHARAIEPPGPMAPTAAATKAAGKAEPPVAAALHDALRAAADKLRHKHKRKRKHKHDSSAKKSKKVRARRCLTSCMCSACFLSYLLTLPPACSTRRGRESARNHRRAAAAAAAAAARTAAQAEAQILRRRPVVPIALGVERAPRVVSHSAASFPEPSRARSSLP